MMGKNLLSRGSQLFSFGLEFSRKEDKKNNSYRATSPELESVALRAYILNTVKFNDSNFDGSFIVTDLNLF